MAPSTATGDRSSSSGPTASLSIANEIPPRVASTTEGGWRSLTGSERVTIARSPDQPIEISLVEALCLNCGRLIAVTVPYWHVSKGAPRDKKAKSLRARLEPWPGFGDPDMCFRCRMHALPAPRGHVYNEYRAIVEKAAKAGIPDGATIWPISFAVDGDTPNRWQGWRGLMLAIQVSGLPRRLLDAPMLNSVRLNLADGRSSIELVVYRTDLRTGAVGLRQEVRRRPVRLRRSPPPLPPLPGPGVGRRREDRPARMVVGARCARRPRARRRLPRRRRSRSRSRCP